MGKLTAFYETFAALDGVKEYLARRKKVWGLPGSRAQPTMAQKIMAALPCMSR